LLSKLFIPRNTPGTLRSTATQTVSVTLSLTATL